MADTPSLIFVTGGVRSGKSTYAEKRAIGLAERTGCRLHYIAAGQSSDPEMRERILRHQQDRREAPLPWATWEQPAGLAKLAEAFTAEDIVLLDCLTTLLNNELFLSGEWWKDREFQERTAADILSGISQISRKCKALIIVSNEVVYEPFEQDGLVYTYARMIGELHQKAVAMADQAYLVEAGLPILMKGMEK